MTREEKRILYQKIIKSRSRLIKEYPFYGTLLLSLQLLFAECQTACTDGKHIYMDPNFVSKLKEEELEFLLLHELMHCVLNHITRGKGKDAYLFNVACDIVANSNIFKSTKYTNIKILNEVPMHTIKVNGIEEEGYLYDAEKVYRILLNQKSKQDNKKNKNSDKDPDNGPGSGSGSDSPETSGGNSFDRHDVWEDIEETPRSMESSWEQKIVDAASKTGSFDDKTLPDGVRNILTEYLEKGKVNWKEVLYEHLEASVEKDYTYHPPNRKSVHRGVYIPSLRPQDKTVLDDIWILIDASGSMGIEEIRVALSEVVSAMNQLSITGRFSYFASKVSEPKEFQTEEDILKTEPRNIGLGTSFYNIFTYLKEHPEDLHPKVTLIFTDGYAAFPTEEEALGPEDTTVIWAFTDDRMEAPWGINIPLKGLI